MSDCYLCSRDFCILPHSFQHTSCHVSCPISHLKTKNQSPKSKQKVLLTVPWRHCSICFLLISSFQNNSIPGASISSLPASVQHAHQAFNPIHTMETALARSPMFSLPSSLANFLCFSCLNFSAALKTVDYSVLETPFFLCFGETKLFQTVS